MAKQLCIGLNALFLVPGEVGGTEFFARGLFSALSQRMNLRCILYINKSAETSFSKRTLSPNSEVRVVCGANKVERLLAEQWFFAQQAKEDGCQILHSLAYWGPIRSVLPHVITVHDANWRDHPEDVSWFSRQVLEQLIVHSTRAATHTVSDSAFGAQRVLHHRLFPPGQKQVSVISPGLEKIFFQSKSRRINSKSFLSGPYIFCPSAFYPHKQVPYALRLWQNLAEQLPHFRFVLLGRRGRDEQTVATLSSQLPRVQWLQTVTQAELQQWYQQAACVLFPSVYEGFGFPVYEALASGQTVFVGKKALYASALQPFLQELSFSVESDASLLSQFLLSQFQPNGVSHTVLPTWEQAAQQYETLYRSLV